MIAPILLVDDSDDDVLFMRRAMNSAGISNPVSVVQSGLEAINYLAGRENYGDRTEFPMPALVLLDLKLPIIMGLDVLKWVREQPSLDSLVIIVLTASAEPVDVRMAYSLGARSFLVKPASPDRLLELVKAFRDYWLTCNQFPPA